MKARQYFLGSLLCLASASLLFVSHSFAHHTSSQKDKKAVAESVQSLDVYAANGKQHLLLGTSGENGVQVSYLVSADDGITWSAPVRVDSGAHAPRGLARGNDAQIAAAGDHLIAVWETAGDDQWGGGPMATALSSDAGKTWRAGPNPADDNLKTGHISIDLTVDGQGFFHLVWLDGRAGKQGLRYARSDDAGEHWSKNSTLDPETCECCWNAIIAGSGPEVYTLYRDKDPRDMALAASADDGKTWKRASTVVPFGWQFNGCPDVGGGLALTNKALHTIVWTGRHDAAGVYHVMSNDGGAHWAAPQQLGDRDARHADIAAKGSSIVAAWDTAAKGIVTAVSQDDGQTWTTAPVPGARGDATHPRLLPTRDGFRVFWTEMSDDQSVWRSAPVAGRSGKDAGPANGP